jgi:nucleoside-triphosphatase THEP1
MYLSVNNEISAKALQFVNSTNRHVFLTGKAGTGKTTFLKEITHLTHKKTIVAAPTGIAAINAGGVTLHSLFQLPFGTFIPDNSFHIYGEINIQIHTPHSFLAKQQMHSNKRNLLRELELLIIDEVSMLRADILDAIDTVLRHVRRKKHLPFGGVQILFIGDLFQLPPVVKEDEWAYLKNYYSSMFFFEAKALQNNMPVYIELEKIYRQSNQDFIDILNNLRENRIVKKDIDKLNEYYQPGFTPKPKEGYVFLTTHNYKADNINSEELKKINKKSFKYQAAVEGDFPEYMYPLEEILELKAGAQVMFVKNDYSGEGKYFNGKIGTISSLENDYIKVDLNDGTDPINIEKYTWENKKFSLNAETNEIEENIIGTFTQYPIKLAWAITIHKSQGLTFDKAIIDISRAFAAGQIYVALSRLTSLDGLVLTAPMKLNVPEQAGVLKEYMKSKQSPEELAEAFKHGLKEYIDTYVREAFNFEPLLNQINYYIAGFGKGEKATKKDKYKPWAVGLKELLLPPYDVSKKFLIQIDKISKLNAENYLVKLLERVQAAKTYFEPILKDFSEKINQPVKELSQEKRVKKYINELKDLDRVFFGQLQKIYKAEALIEAVIKNTELSKEKINKLQPEKHEREIVKPEKQKAESKKLVKKQKTPTIEKIPTKEISYRMFKEGKTLSEIAEERGIKERTIQEHLVPFVENGSLDVFNFVSKEKFEQIAKVHKTMENNFLTPIKEQLGDDYTWEEIKFAVAYLKGNKDYKL